MIKFSGNKDCLKINLELGDQFTENYRNIQNTNGRLIYYFENACKFKKSRVNLIFILENH